MCSSRAYLLGQDPGLDTFKMLECQRAMLPPYLSTRKRQNDDQTRLAPIASCLSIVSIERKHAPDVGSSIIRMSLRQLQFASGRTLRTTGRLAPTPRAAR